MTHLFVLGHGIVVFVVCLALPKTIFDDFFNDSFTATNVDFFAYLFYCEKVFGFLAYASMVLLFTLSLFEILKFSKKNHAWKTTLCGKRRGQLITALFYCTLPTIFLLLELPYNLCVIMESTGLSESNFTCTTFEYIHTPITTIRFFAASICILLAFPDYRQIFLRVITKVDPLFYRNSSVYASTFLPRQP
ncbi:hypothetical protein L596_012105 [Steinernema carpocapsae]|uniref:Uncharacterized protein n=1 Tax=Steinernema carpocapsae TaxID=34508 RepID=A0A4U5NWX0_STECR|nr:hypothetical protein L596_012105 [Steinernema carpocapsae]